MTAPPYVVYLLHLARPIDAEQHYLGCTRTDRLMLRMHEHRIGRGARMTRQAVAEGIGLVLVRAIPAEGFEHERRLRRRGHFRQLCPLCEPYLCKSEIAPMILPARRTPARTAWPSWAGLCNGLRGLR